MRLPEPHELEEQHQRRLERESPAIEYDKCIVCDQTITDGEKATSFNEEEFHAECFEDYIEDERRDYTL